MPLEAQTGRELWIEYGPIADACCSRVWRGPCIPFARTIAASRDGAALVSSTSSDANPASSEQAPPIEASVDINRPVDEVFAFMDEPCNTALWQQGTTGRTAVRILGRGNTVDWTITEYEPNRRVTWESSIGGFSLDTIWRYEPVPEGTRVTVTEQAPPWLRGVSAGRAYGELRYVRLRRT